MVGVKGTYKKIGIKCECGFIATGNSEKMARANLKGHRKSNYHKRLMAMNKDVSMGLITDISGSNVMGANK